MYVNISILLVVLFITFCIIWKNELLKNIFFTIWFIITLWINIPSFVDVQNIINIDENLLILPVKLSKELGPVFIILANMILCITLFVQSKFSDQNTYTYKAVKKKYDEFVLDATQLYVIGRDLDFLGKNKFKKQKERMTHLDSKCKLLCEYTNNKELLNLYNKISNEGLEIKFYTESDSITNLKGQIKVDHSGNKKAIFMSKKNRRYSLLDIDNQFLVDSILERYHEVYSKSIDPGK